MRALAFTGRDDFSILAEIAHSGSGAVYRARHRATGTAVVLKERRVAELGKEADLLHEWKLLSAVSHPGIIGCYGHFLDEARRTAVVVLEYAGGGDLYHELQRRRHSRRHLPPELLWSLFEQIASAAAHLHAKGIVHRDIKLGDLGVARVVAEEGAMMSTMVGTPLYLSPEVCQRRPYTHRTDLWALGCLLHEMAALRPPFEAPSMRALFAAIAEARFAPLRAPATDAGAASQVVTALLQRDPSRRVSASTAAQWARRRLRRLGALPAAAPRSVTPTRSRAASPGRGPSPVARAAGGVRAGRAAVDIGVDGGDAAPAASAVVRVGHKAHGRDLPPPVSPSSPRSPLGRSRAGLAGASRRESVCACLSPSPRASCARRHVIRRHSPRGAGGGGSDDEGKRGIRSGVDGGGVGSDAALGRRAGAARGRLRSPGPGNGPRASARRAPRRPQSAAAVGRRREGVEVELESMGGACELVGYDEGGLRVVRVGRRRRELAGGADDEGRKVGKGVGAEPEAAGCGGVEAAADRGGSPDTTSTVEGPATGDEWVEAAVGGRGPEVGRDGSGQREGEQEQESGWGVKLGGGKAATALDSGMCAGCECSPARSGRAPATAAGEASEGADAARQRLAPRHPAEAPRPQSARDARWEQRRLARRGTGPGPRAGGSVVASADRGGCMGTLPPLRAGRRKDAHRYGPVPAVAARAGCDVRVGADGVEDAAGAPLVRRLPRRFNVLTGEWER